MYIIHLSFRAKVRIGNSVSVDVIEGTIGNDWNEACFCYFWHLTVVLDPLASQDKFALAQNKIKKISQ